MEFINNLTIDNIQANIHKGHGRKYVRCVFIKKEHVLINWIKKHSHLVTSARQQYFQKKIRKYGQSIVEDNKNRLPRLLTCFFISSEGNKTIGGGKPFLPLDDQAFKDQMNGRLDQNGNHILNDSPVNSEKRDPKYNGKIYGMVLLAYHDEVDEARGNRYLDQVINVMFKGAKRNVHYFEEKGTVLRRNNQAIEHFGYADGISQPNLLTGNDPPQLNEDTCKDLIFDNLNGSYLVFRKLEQNVEKFNDIVKAKAANEGIEEHDAGAKIIGRFKNGDTITHLDPIKRKLDIQARNVFNKNIYEEYHKEDKEGQRCPFSSHIRKANPRTNETAASRKAKIVRRGVPYDDRENPQIDNEPEENVGLLFMCYQNNIADQFEHIQRHWCNNNNFPSNNGNELDPIIGQTNGDNPEQVVTLKGGEYFYAPSIAIIETLRLRAQAIKELA